MFIKLTINHQYCFIRLNDCILNKIHIICFLIIYRVWIRSVRANNNICILWKHRYSFQCCICTECRHPRSMLLQLDYRMAKLFSIIWNLMKQWWVLCRTGEQLLLSVLEQVGGTFCMAFRHTQDFWRAVISGLCPLIFKFWVNNLNELEQWRKLCERQIILLFLKPDDFTCLLFHAIYGLIYIWWLKHYFNNFVTQLLRH